MKIKNLFLALSVASMLSISCSKDVELESVTKAPAQQGYAISVEGSYPSAKSTITDEGDYLSYKWEATDALYAIILDDESNPILFNNNTQEYANVEVTPDVEDATQATLTFTDLTLAESIPAGSIIYLATAGESVESDSGFGYDFTYPATIEELTALSDYHVVMGSAQIADAVDLSSGGALNESITLNHFSSLLCITLVNEDKTSAAVFSDFKVEVAEALSIYPMATIGLGGEVATSGSAVTSLIDLDGSEITIPAGGEKSYYISFVSKEVAIDNDDALFTITAGGKTASATKGSFTAEGTISFDNGDFNSIEFSIPTIDYREVGKYLLTDFTDNLVPTEEVWEIYGTSKTTITTENGAGLLYAVENATSDVTLRFGDYIYKVDAYVFQDADETKKYGKLTKLEFTNSKSDTDATSGYRTAVGNYAFQGCTSLAAIVGSDNLFEATTNCFQGCTSLGGEIDLSNLSAGKLGGSAFIDTAITKVTFGSNLTIIPGYCFKNCKQLAEFVVVDGTNNFTLGAGAFANCSDLTEITLDRATSFGANALSGCSSLTKISARYEGAITVDATSFSNTESCDLYLNDNKITTDTQTATSTPEAIIKDGACTWGGFTWNSINDLSAEVDGYTLAEFNSYITENGTPFIPEGTTWVITDETIGDAVDVSAASAVGNATTSTYGLYKALNASTAGSITLQFPNATLINNYAFKLCTGIGKVEIPLVTSVNSSGFVECVNMTSIELNVDITNIGGYGINKCYALTSVTFSDDLENRVATKLVLGNSAFAANSVLTSLTLPVTELGNAPFDKCTQLTTLDLSYCKVTSINATAFTASSTYSEACALKLHADNYVDVTDYTTWQGLTWASINDYPYTLAYFNSYLADNGEPFIPEGTTWVVGGATIGTGVDETGYESIDDVDSDNYATSTYGLAASLNAVDAGSITLELPSTTTLSQNALRSCMGIGTAKLPKVTSVGAYGFMSCESMTSIVLNVDITNIGGFGINKCFALASVTYSDDLENRVADALVLGQYAFANDTELKSLTVPATSCGNYILSATPLESLDLSYATVSTYTATSFDGAKADNSQDFTEGCALTLNSTNYAEVTSGTSWAGFTWLTIDEAGE